MWLFTKYGFFSAVNARKGDGSRGQPVDPDWFMIRARNRKHLENLKAAYPEHFEGVVITDSAHTDYRCRMFVSKTVWATVLSQLVTDQCYDNFKHETQRAKIADVEYEAVLHRVWGVMYGYQSGLYGPGIYTRKPTDLTRHDFDGINQALGEETPEDHAKVLLVRNQDTGVDVGVIWWIEDAYLSNEEAYADAVECESLELVAHPEFERVMWADVRDTAIPIFDPYAQTSRDEV